MVRRRAVEEVDTFSHKSILEVLVDQISVPYFEGFDYGIGVKDLTSAAAPTYYISSCS
jgi:hypothetical protein